MSENDPTASILPDLNSETRCGILSNAKGDIIIVHEHDIAGPLQWIEYDIADGDLLLVHENGVPQNLGITISDKMKNNLTHGTEVTVIRLDQKKIAATEKVLLLVKDY